MQQTAQIVSKLRNARFQPPRGPKEKLAWINDTEADLLRSIGGSGKKRKFGLPSFSWRDDSGSDNARGTDDGNGGSKSSSNSTSGGGDKRGGTVYTQRSVPGAKTPTTGNWNTGGDVVSVGSFKDGYTRVDQPTRAPMAPRAPNSKPPIVAPPPPLTVVAPPVVAPPVAPPVVAPPVALQNYGFVAPPVKAPAVVAQNYGFVAPAPKPAAPKAPATSVTPQNYGFTTPSAPAVRDDRMPTAPATKAKENYSLSPRDDRMPAAPKANDNYSMSPRDDRAPPTYSEAPRTDRAPMAPAKYSEAPRTDRAPMSPAAPTAVTSMFAEAQRRAKAARLADQYSKYRSPPSDTRLGPKIDAPATTQPLRDDRMPPAAIRDDRMPVASPPRTTQPIGGIPTPRQNPLRDLTKFNTDGTFNTATDFGLIEGAALSRLAALQDKFGKPITVTEGAAPLGTHVKASQHHINPKTDKANALDLKVSPADRATLARLANEVGWGGIGAYGDNLPGMVHVDTGKVRSWGPGGKAVNISKLKDKALQAALRDRTRKTTNNYADLGDDW